MRFVKCCARWLAVAILLLAALVVMAAGVLLQQIGGAFRFEPEALQAELSKGARALMRQAFVDIPPGAARDYHVHIVGLGTGDTGAAVNPKMLSWAHPLQRAKTAVYLSGAAVEDVSRADQQYVERLLRLVRNIKGHGKFHILALDHYYNPDGTVDREKSSFYTPNDYVFRLATRHPDAFVPVVSVHPYRADALSELQKWASQGIRFVKWLPNAQGMDAADPRIDDYYRLMRRYAMVLLTHVGKEQAVDGARDQELGNPLRFRRPLDLGVKVIMAHCASLGENEDLDNPGRTASSFDLFMRLMDDSHYEGLLFGELSAITQVNRLSRPLLELLRRSDLHHRLVNGSDYPLPAINAVIHTYQLVRLGVITAEERRLLNEIYDYNPLLFDFVLKRTLRAPDTGQQFAAEIFRSNISTLADVGGVRLRSRTLAYPARAL